MLGLNDILTYSIAYGIGEEEAMAKAVSLVTRCEKAGGLSSCWATRKSWTHR